MISAPQQDLPDLPGPIDEVVETGLGIVTGTGPGAAILNPGGFIQELIEDWLADVAASAVGTVTEWLVDAMSDNTEVDLSLVTESETYQMVGTLAAATVLIYVLVGIIKSLFSGDPSTVVKVLAYDLPVAFLLSVMCIGFGTALLAIVDEATAVFIADVPATMETVFRQLHSGAESSIIGELVLDSPLMGLIATLIFVLGATLLWIELLLRDALVMVFAALSPLAYATRASPTTKEIASRFTKSAMALIVAKLPVGVAFSLTGALVGDQDDPIRKLATVIALLIVAAMSPWLLFKLVPIAYEASAMDGQAQRPKEAAWKTFDGAANTAFKGIALTDMLGGFHGFKRRAQLKAERKHPSPAGGGSGGTGAGGGGRGGGPGGRGPDDPGGGGSGVGPNGGGPSDSPTDGGPAGRGPGGGRGGSRGPGRGAGASGSGPGRRPGSGSNGAGRGPGRRSSGPGRASYGPGRRSSGPGRASYGPGRR